MSPRKNEESTLIDKSRSEVAPQGRISHTNAFCAEALSVEVNALKEKVGRVVRKEILDRESPREWIECLGILIGGLIALQNLLNTEMNNKIMYAVAATSVAAYGLLFLGFLVWKLAKRISQKSERLMSIDDMVEELRADSKRLDVPGDTTPKG